jgi:hypothetical protein
LEVGRLADLADALGAYEAGPAWLVMVDDSPIARGLERHVRLPAGWTAVSLHHRRVPAPEPFRHGGGLCSSVLMGLEWVQANTGARFVLKLDTDSLVINPFCDALARLFEADPALGMAGAYTLSPNDTPRKFHFHGRTVLRLLERPFDWRKPLSGFRGAATTDLGRVIAAALANGYRPGENCLGGGYALSRAMLDRMARSGHFDELMHRWMHVDMAEDVMVGLHARAVGMTLANFVRPGQVFGVRYQGLPGPVERLVERGYAVIHSVKNDPRADEASVRAFFKQRRSASPAGRPRQRIPA